MSPSRLRRIMDKYPNYRHFNVWQIRLDVARQHREARANKNLDPDFAPLKADDPCQVPLVQRALRHPCEEKFKKYQEPWATIRAITGNKRRVLPCRSIYRLPLP